MAASEFDGKICGSNEEHGTDNIISPVKVQNPERERAKNTHKKLSS